MVRLILLSRIFFDKRIGQEVEADTLGDDFKGYVFKITGGNDKDGFPMMQGVATSDRVRLLLKEGSSCYRPRRKGERRRKSVRGCIVSPHIRALSLVLVKKGEKEIPGLTDITKPRRLGPKRVTRIRKLYGLEKGDNVEALVKKNVIRRTFTSKKNAGAPQRQKAPKIQRLVTDARLRRKKLIKKEKADRWKKTQAAISEYQKLYNEWSDKKRKEQQNKEKQAEEKKTDKPKEEKPKDAKKDTKVDAKKDVKKDAKKDTKATTTKTTTQVVQKTDSKKDAPKAKDTKTAPATKTTEVKKSNLSFYSATSDNKPAADSGVEVKKTITKVVKKPVKPA